MQDAEGAELVCNALAEAAAAGGAVVVLGRDHALRTIAERAVGASSVWCGGKLRPLGEIALDGATIDELLIDIESAPVRPAADKDIDPRSSLPFPVTARTAGVA